MISMLGKNVTDNILKYFSYFSQEQDCDTLWKLAPLETICLKCQILYFRKNKKNINLSPAEFAHSMESINCIDNDC